MSESVVPGPPLTADEIAYYQTLTPCVRDGREVCPVCELPVWTADLPTDSPSCLPTTCRAWRTVGVWNDEARDFVPEPS